MMLVMNAMDVMVTKDGRRGFSSTAGGGFNQHLLVSSQGFSFSHLSYFSSRSESLS